LAVEELISFIKNDLYQKFPTEVNRIFIFSNLFKLRYSRDDHIDLISSLTSNFPEIAFFFPAYTYNSRTSLQYSDNQKPNPQCGSLSRVVFEVFKDLSIRTLDEDYSYLVLNHQSLSKRFLSNALTWRDSSFGELSHHSSLFSESGVFLIIGDEMCSGFTPSMQCEAMATVPYREMEMFPAMAQEGLYKRYFARKEKEFKSFGKENRKRSLELMRRAGVLSTCNHELGPKTFAFPIRHYIDSVTNELNANPNYFTESRNVY
jgi:hypothetical protein